MSALRKQKLIISVQSITHIVQKPSKLVDDQVVNYSNYSRPASGIIKPYECVSSSK